MKIKKLFIYSAYLLISSLILLEIIFRILPTAQLFDLDYTLNDDEIIRYKPYQTITWSIDYNFTKVVEKNTNNLGFVNDYDYHQNSKIEYAIIGDSFIEALHVNYKESLMGLLGDNFGNNNVYSFGISGFSLADYIQISKYVINEYQPKNIIFLIYGNDFYQSFCKHNRKPLSYCYDENLNLSKKNLKKDFNFYLKSIARESAFVRYLYLNLKLNNLKNNNKTTNFDLNNISQQMDFRLIDYFINYLNSIKDESDISVMIDPDRQAIYAKHENFDYLVDEIYANNVEYLEKNLKLNDFNVLNLECRFEKNFLKNRKKFEYRNDGHWNSLGHKIAYDAIIYNDDLCE